MEVELDKDSATQQDIEFKSVGQQLKLFFSYTTIIAFEINYKRFVCENVWSRTTARHLNELEGNKKNRIPRKEFLHRLEKIEFHLNF